MEINITDSLPRLTIEDVASLESRLGYQLPPQYRDFLLKYNGGVPDRCLFEYEWRVGVKTKAEVECFLNLQTDNWDNIEKVLDNFDELMLPPKVLPIASSTGSDLICISCQEKTFGQICIWDNSEPLDDGSYENIYFVAPTLEAFLDQLYAPVKLIECSYRKINLRNVYPPVKEAEVEDIESRLGCHFPQAYRDFILHCNGGLPDKSMISYFGHNGEKYTELVSKFLSVRVELEDINGIPLFEHELRSHKTRKDMLTIGATWDGKGYVKGSRNNHICIACNEENLGQIYLWEEHYRDNFNINEENFFWIADTFESFLEMLQARDEERFPYLKLMDWRGFPIQNS